MKPLKLAIVSPYPPSKGTLNEYAYHLVAQFAQKPAIEEIIIFSDQLPGKMGYESSSEYPHVKVKGVWGFNSWSTLWKIRKAIRQSRPDIVFYNLQFLSFGDKKIPATLGLLSPLITRWSGIPSVVLLHNIVESVDLESAGITKNPLLKWIFKSIGTLVTRMVLSASLVTVTISKYVRILEEKYKTNNIAWVPHGSFDTPPLPDFSLPPGPKKVMTFGKFGTYKKVEPIIEAVEKIRADIEEPIEIVVAGTDSPNVKGYLEGVQTKYAHVPQLTFTGYVEEEDVPRIFQESAMVVFPYTSTTGSSGVLHQAGSYGKAAILPQIGDLAALIEEEGYQGEYFDPEDVDSLATAIGRLIREDEHRISLARQNYEAAASLPLLDIADWYLLHFFHLLRQNRGASS